MVNQTNERDGFVFSTASLIPHLINDDRNPLTRERVDVIHFYALGVLDRTKLYFLRSRPIDETFRTFVEGDLESNIHTYITDPQQDYVAYDQITFWLEHYNKTKCPNFREIALSFLGKFIEKLLTCASDFHNFEKLGLDIQKHARDRYVNYYLGKIEGEEFIESKIESIKRDALREAPRYVGFVVQTYQYFLHKPDDRINQLLFDYFLSNSTESVLIHLFSKFSDEEIDGLSTNTVFDNYLNNSLNEIYDETLDQLKKSQLIGRDRSIKLQKWFTAYRIKSFVLFWKSQSNECSDGFDIAWELYRQHYQDMVYSTEDPSSPLEDIFPQVIINIIKYNQFVSNYIINYFNTTDRGFLKFVCDYFFSQSSEDILIYLVNHFGESHFSEDYFDAKFDCYFNNLSTEVVQTLHDRLKERTVLDEKRSLFVMMWMIKKKTNREYMLPELSDVTSYSMTQLLAAPVDGMTDYNLESGCFVARQLDGVVFEKLRIPMINSSRHINDPFFCKRMTFTSQSDYFFTDSLAIGVYEKNNVELQYPQLLAYDLKTQEMKWRVPLYPELEKCVSFRGVFPENDLPRPQKKGSNYLLQKLGQDKLLLGFEGVKQVYLIDVKTGAVNKFAELPAPHPSSDGRRQFGITLSNNGFMYLKGKDSKRYLIGGKIENGIFEETFRQNTSIGKIKFFGDYVSIFSLYNEKLTIVDSEGTNREFPNVVDVEYHDDRLFYISDLEAGVRYLRVLDLSSRDCPIIKQCRLSVGVNEIEKICENNKVVLSHSHYECKDYYQLDLSNERLSCYQSLSQSPAHVYHYINPRDGKLWLFDEPKNKLFTSDLDGVKPVADLTSSRGTKLMYVDKQDQLYFTNIPY